MLGREPGSDFSNLEIRLRAAEEILDGMWYSFFLMRVYVSFKHDVSNGGLPTSNVYLWELEQANAYDKKNTGPNLIKITTNTLHQVTLWIVTSCYWAYTCA